MLQKCNFSSGVFVWFCFCFLNFSFDVSKTLGSKYAYTENIKPLLIVEQNNYNKFIRLIWCTFRCTSGGVSVPYIYSDERYHRRLKSLLLCFVWRLSSLVCWFWCIPSVFFSFFSFIISPFSFFLFFLKPGKVQYCPPSELDCNVSLLVCQMRATVGYWGLRCWVHEWRLSSAN